MLTAHQRCSSTAAKFPASPTKCSKNSWTSRPRKRLPPENNRIFHFAENKRNSASDLSWGTALGQPYFRALAGAEIHHVRRDHEKQFIRFIRLAVGDHDLVYPGNASQPGDSVQAELLALAE